VFVIVTGAFTQTVEGISKLAVTFGWQLPEILK
jgi:hypothetical protein